MTSNLRETLKYSLSLPLFFKEVLGLEMKDFHREWLEHLANNRYAILLAPRNHGKTTVMLGYAAWSICTNRDIRILYLTSKHDRAQEFTLKLQNILVYNDKLRSIFGDLKTMHSTWKKDSFTVAGRSKLSPKKEPTFTATSITAEDIGGHYDLIMCDDIVHIDNSDTEHKRMKLKEKFDAVIDYMLEPNGGIKIIGTRWHENDLYSVLMSLQKYKTKVYKAIINEETKEVLWPERISYEELVKQREEKGFTIFSMQSQNEIIARQGNFFNIEKLCKYEHAPENLTIYLGVDLATEKGKDYFVIMVIGVDSLGDIYVLDYYRGHLSLSDQIDKIALFDDIWKPAKIIIESNAYQNIFLELLKDYGQTMPVFPYVPTKNKTQRAERLSAIIEAGKVYVKEKMTELIDELSTFPYGAHDDLIDALVMAIEGCEKRKVKQFRPEVYVSYIYAR